MIEKLRQSKRGVTIILALVGISVMAAYSFCADSCIFLRGTMFGMDLKYLGMLYMGLVLAAGAFGKDAACAVLLSIGVGGEVFLLGFQTMNGVYCPYCLAFAAIVILLFLIHAIRIRPAMAILFAAVGFSIFLLFFSGSAAPAYADEIPSFGRGSVKVRIYTDYFCPTCRSIEPELEPVIVDLVKRRLAVVTFVDTPFHKETGLYATCFLGIAVGDGNLPRTLEARLALFKAAEKNIRRPPELKSLMGYKGLKCHPLDPTRTFNILNKRLKEDRIDSTPACVVERPGGKQKFTGSSEIMKALNRLREVS